MWSPYICLRHGLWFNVDIREWHHVRGSMKIMGPFMGPSLSGESEGPMKLYRHVNFGLRITLGLVGLDCLFRRMYCGIQIPALVLSMSTSLIDIPIFFSIYCSSIFNVEKIISHAPPARRSVLGASDYWVEGLPNSWNCIFWMCSQKITLLPFQLDWQEVFHELLRGSSPLFQFFFLRGEGWSLLLSPNRLSNPFIQ